MFRLIAIFRELTTKQLKTHSSEIVKSRNMEEADKVIYPFTVCISKYVLLISNFRLILNVVCFLLSNSPASEFYMPTFRNTLFHLHMRVWRWNRQNVPTRWHIKFRRPGITQKKAYNICAFVGTERLLYNLQNSCNLKSWISTLSDSDDAQRDQKT